MKTTKPAKYDDSLFTRFNCEGCGKKNNDILKIYNQTSYLKGK